MEERPIIFSGEMVKAILDGRKTMTRRVVKPQPSGVNVDKLEYKDTPGLKMTSARGGIIDFPENCPYGIPGDRLWVRETWWKDILFGRVYYRADYHDGEFKAWKPSIHMPRKYSRITLEITNVRVERLQEITSADAIKEGCSVDRFTPGEYKSPWYDLTQPIAINNFSSLWDSLNGKKYPWSSNPWVWCLTFKRI
jgi:hypothetical protein